MGCTSSQAAAWTENDEFMVQDASQAWRPARLIDKRYDGPERSRTLVVEFIDRSSDGAKLEIREQDIPLRIRRLRRASEGDAWAKRRPAVPLRHGSTGSIPKVALGTGTSSLSPGTDRGDSTVAIVKPTTPRIKAAEAATRDSTPVIGGACSGDDADSEAGESDGGVSGGSRERRRVRRRSSSSRSAGAAKPPLTSSAVPTAAAIVAAAAATSAAALERTTSPVATASSASSQDHSGAVQEHQAEVFCLKTYQQSSGKWVSRWEPATVKQWQRDPTTGAVMGKIGFDGRSKRHDITLSMATDWPRLVLRGDLSEKEIESGAPLSGAAKERSRRFFSLLPDGELSDPPDSWHWTGSPSKSGGGGSASASAGGGSRSSSGRSRARPSGAAPGFAPGRVFHAGDDVDCLDFFQSSKTGLRTSRWRPAVVVGTDVREGRRCLQIHYKNWADKWDCWLDADTELYRLAPAYSRVRLPQQQPSSSAAEAEAAAGRASRSSGKSGRYSDGESQRRRSSQADGASAQDLSPSDAAAAAAGRPRRAGSNGGGGSSGRSSSGRRSRSGGGGGYGAYGGHVSRSSSYPPDLLREEEDDGFMGSSGGVSDEAFCEALRRRGLEVLEVEPDGNCLFRAVAHQIYGDPDLHHEVRKACADHMARHRARFSTFVAEDFSEYLRRVRQTCVWGDDLEIRALEEVYDRPIHIYAPHAEGFGPMKIDFDAGARASGGKEKEKEKEGAARRPSSVGEDVAPITLSYHGQSHYNSVHDRRYGYPLQPRPSQAILALRISQHAAGPAPAPAAAAASASAAAKLADAAAAAPGGAAGGAWRSGRSMAGGGMVPEQTPLSKRRWAGLARPVASRT